MSNICNKISTETRSTLFNFSYQKYVLSSFKTNHWNLVFKSLLLGKIGPIFVGSSLIWTLLLDNPPFFIFHLITFFWSEKKELIVKWTGFIKCFRGICFENKSVGGYSTLFLYHEKFKKNILYVSSIYFFWKSFEKNNKILTKLKLAAFPTRTTSKHRFSH